MNDPLFPFPVDSALDPRVSWRTLLSPALAPKVALALALLAISGASLGLCIAFPLLSDANAFLITNAASGDERRLLLLSLAAGAMLYVLAGLFPILFGRTSTVMKVVRVADLLAPTALIGLVPILFAHRIWNSQPLRFLALLAIAVIVAEWLVARCLNAVPGYVHRSLAQLRLPARIRVHAPTVVVVVGALSYAAYFSHYTILNHQRFNTAAYDLGINVNWCFNALRGHPFRTTVLFPEGGSMIAGHAIFAVFLWLPIYALKPGAEVLLIYQSFMVGIAAVPLYLFARTQVPRWSAALVALAYLLYAPLHGPNFYDYHELPVALPWHFSLYWLLATHRYKLAALTVAIICAHREDLAVGLVLLGIFLVLSGARPRFGASLAVACLIWFIVDKFVIMPAAGSWWFASMYKDLSPAGAEGYGPIVQTTLINPVYFLSTLLRQEKLVYFLHLFAPLAFLPLRRPLLFLLAFPGFFFTLMTTEYAPTVSISFQYTTHWVPYVFAAIPIALRLLGTDGGVIRRRAALAALMLGTLSHSTVFGAVIQRETLIGGFTRVEFVQTSKELRDYASFKKLVAKIPPEASVAATDAELAHVAARLNAFTLRSAHGDADYILVRKGGGMSQSVLQSAFDRNQYGLVQSSRGVLFLFKKGHQSPDTERALSQLRVRAKPGARE